MEDSQRARSTLDCPRIFAYDRGSRVLNCAYIFPMYLGISLYYGIIKVSSSVRPRMIIQHEHGHGKIANMRSGHLAYVSMQVNGT